MAAINLENRSANINPFRYGGDRYHEPVEYLLVQCIRCPAEHKIDAPHATTDQVARKWFGAAGWSIKPTLCPQCRHAPEDAADLDPTDWEPAPPPVPESELG